MKVPRPSGTWAMPRRTMSSVARPAMRCPSKRTSPAVFTIPQTARSVVVLPAPFAPRIVVIPPSSTAKDRPWRTFVQPYCASSPSTSSRAIRRPRRARRLDPLERAEREPRGWMIRDGLEVQEREELARRGADGLLLMADPGQAQRVREEIAARPAVDADHDVLEHRQRRKEREVLERAADAELGDAMRRQRQERAALEEDGAAIRR